MLATGGQSFYKVENGKRLYYDVATKAYKPVPGGEAFIILNNYSDKIIWKNSACTVYDIGNDVASLEWKTKMNTIGGEVLEGINRAISSG
ncbi:MAG: hypothetical protein WKG06_14025 [Segetibacter sp.]